MTALEFAVFKKDAVMEKLLLDAGATPGLATSKWVGRTLAYYQCTQIICTSNVGLQNISRRSTQHSL